MSGLRDELQSIYDQRGQLTPALVVDEARPPEHPLHNRFEWDDSVAGERWRERQAHELIRSVRVVYREATDTERERSVRGFHAVRNDDGHVYEPAETVANDPLMRKVLLADMQREWKALHARWREFEEFSQLVREDVDSEVA